MNKPSHCKLLPLIIAPNPILYIPCDPVVEFDQKLTELISDMLFTMYSNKGIGLAANQVGHSISLFVMDTSPERDKPQIFVNPKIVFQRGRIVIEEGCLSFPDLTLPVARADHIRVKAQDTLGKPVDRLYKGIDAVCIQHEIDHMNGTTFEQRAK